MQNIRERQFHTINLFSGESAVYENTNKWSLDEAFVKSNFIIHTAYIKQIDYSNERNVKPFYIYEIDEGIFEKSKDTNKNKLPLLFLSKQKLFKGKELRDSVCLFLTPIKQYKVLRNHIGVKYEWIDEAPFISMKKK